MNVVNRISGSAIPSMPRKYSIPKAGIQDIRSANCIPV
jgi:hypothetical protein